MNNFFLKIIGQNRTFYDINTHKCERCDDKNCDYCTNN